MQPGRKVIGAGSTLDGGSRGSDTTGINDNDDGYGDDGDDDDDNCGNEFWKIIEIPTQSLRLCKVLDHNKA